MKRRLFLAAVSTVPLAGCGGVLGEGEFNSFLGGIRSGEWTADGTLRVSLADDHEVETLVLLPPGGELSDGPLGEWEVDQFDAEVELDVIRQIGPDVRGGVDGWTLEGYDSGALGAIFSGEEPDSKGSLSFSFSPSLSIEKASLDSRGQLEATVRNTGTAPARLIEVEGQRTGSVNQIVRPGETVNVTTEVLEKDERDCVTIAPEVALEFRAVPKQTVEHKHDTGREEEEYVCTTTL